MPPRESTQPEDVSVLIDGVTFSGWDGLEIELALDNFSTIEFDAPFEPDRVEFRRIFKPFSFKPLEVRVDGDTLFKGTLVGIEPRRTANEASVHVTGYAVPAVIQDCMAPGSTVPHSYEKMSLRSVTEALLAPFKIAVQMSEEDPVQFGRALRVKEGQKIYEFLVEIAKQRGYVISNTPGGDFLYWKSVTPGNPVANIVEYEQSLVSVEAQFSAQEYYSEVTGFTAASPKGKRKGNKYTERNPWLLNVLRPMSFHMDDIDKGDVVAATKAKLGRMFSNMASYSIDSLPTWRDPNGALWAPNTTLSVHAPSAMIYRPYELIIRNVKLKQSSKTWTSSLTMVMPGAFSGQAPTHLPWDEDDAVTNQTQRFNIDAFIAQQYPMSGQ